MIKEYIIDGKNLSIDTVYHVAKAQDKTLKISIAPSALSRMKDSRAFVQEIVAKGDPVYGINTGFGALATKHIPRESLSELQYNLIRSHCTGVGEPFSRIHTRAIMLLRANCLASGFSGVSTELVEILLDFIHHGITPVVPRKGSVGASGDLAPLAHIALALIGEGDVLYDGKKVRADFALNQIGRKPGVLGAKDGLALINGTAVMAALGALAIHESRRLMSIADIVSCLTLDSVKGTTQAYHTKISQLKPHQGQLDCNYNLNALLHGSELKDSHPDCGKVQDPYSLRCVPQVHGACRQTLRHADEVFSIELNSVTDNPLIFHETKEVISGGNFHGEACALAMDYLAMGLAELCNISERRIEKMMNPSFSDLPAFLVKEPGLNSGLMIAHVTAAALTSENKMYCHPASVDSIPTSTDKEDHVSMGVTAGLKLHHVLENLKYCLSIELLCNTQALEFQRPLKSSAALESVYTLIRRHVPPIDKDRVLHEDIKSIFKLIETDEILDTVSQKIGALQ
jgi:histidine ammonia-lyase